MDEKLNKLKYHRNKCIKAVGGEYLLLRKLHTMKMVHNIM